MMSMSEANKKITDGKIRQLRNYRGSDLWAGIEAGLRLFDHDASSGRSRALLVLTDGMPTGM